MAIVSGYEVDDDQRKQFEAHEEHDIDCRVEWDGHVTVACCTCYEILIDLYPPVTT